MQIKAGVGKRTLNQSIAGIVDAEVAHGTFALLPITLAQIDKLSSLPNHHRDPFDRLLIAQAIHEGMSIVTADRSFSLYDAAVLWD